MSEWQVLAAAAAIMIGYKFIWFRLWAGFQPIRLELAEVGEALLSSDDLDKREKAFVEFALDWSFSTKAAFVFVAIFPFVPFLAKKGEQKQRWSGLSKERRVELIDFHRKAVFCIVANSPITFVLFGVEFLLLKLLVPWGNGITSTLASAQELRKQFDHWTPWRLQH